MANKVIFCDECKYWNKNFKTQGVEPEVSHLCEYYSVPENRVYFIPTYDDYCENGEEREENK